MELKRWDATLCDLLHHQQIGMRDRLLTRAKQIPRILTNPATLRSSIDDMPLVGEFHD